jgi:hypothetical protein
LSCTSGGGSSAADPFRRAVRLRLTNFQPVPSTQFRKDAFVIKIVLLDISKQNFPL